MATALCLLGPYTRTGAAGGSPSLGLKPDRPATGILPQKRGPGQNRPASVAAEAPLVATVTSEAGAWNWLWPKWL